MTFTTHNDIVYCHTPGRTRPVLTISYADREHAARAIGMRPAVAQAVAGGELRHETAVRLGRAVGLIEEAKSGTHG